jgi:hypothetical protein
LCIRKAPQSDRILTKAGELVGSTSAFSSPRCRPPHAAAIFIFHLCVLLYTMFFFLTGVNEIARCF